MSKRSRTFIHGPPSAPNLNSVRAYGLDCSFLYVAAWSSSEYRIATTENVPILIPDSRNNRIPMEQLSPSLRNAGCLRRTFPLKRNSAFVLDAALIRRTRYSLPREGRNASCRKDSSIPMFRQMPRQKCQPEWLSWKDIGSSL